MPKLIFIEHDGTEHIVAADNGFSVMQAAVDHGVSGIVGECGGALSCATCHGYIDARWQSELDPMTEDERMTLEAVAEIRDNSRLTCQIRVSDKLEGMIVRLPKSQY